MTRPWLRARFDCSPLGPTRPYGPHGRTALVRTWLGVGVTLALLAGAAPALSVALGPRPVLDSLRDEVRIGGVSVIRGHLEGGAPGAPVRLERAGSAGRFKVVDVDTTDLRMRVAFRVAGLRRSAAYRLASTDPLTGVVSHSRAGRIEVRPRLSVHLSTGHTLRGRSVRVSGVLEPFEARRRVIVQKRSHGRWRSVERSRVIRGRYHARFRAASVGKRRVRVRFAGDESNAAAERTRLLRVYRPGLATWYGPGFYGRQTACGKTLGYSTMGVAHRELPCGTRVSLLYGGRTITVRVIDRGPYSAADWDLTGATARRLRFSGIDRVGVVREGS